MKNKKILITGSTSGIGKEAAKSLAKMGANLVIHGRNKEKTLLVQKEIIEHCGHSNVDVLLGDMASMADVKQMAEDYLKKHNSLDVLIHNAGGVMNAKRQLTPDGMERTFAVNVASVYLLTAKLFQTLKKSDDARIILISSMAHKFGKADLNDIHLEKSYSANRAYGNAKLYVLFFMEEMNKRLQKLGIKNISINSLHPGVVATDFAKESKGSMMNFFFKTFRPFLRSPQKGAKTTIYLASSEDVKHISGKYFIDCKPAKVRKTYITEQNTQLLWQLCQQLTNTKDLDFL
jgi:NAD(P)-dependent dehydrogenase (short-subunit alcohol dehydrogenase family)